MEVNHLETAHTAVAQNMRTPEHPGGLTSVRENDALRETDSEGANSDDDDPGAGDEAAAHKVKTAHDTFDAWFVEQAAAFQREDVTEDKRTTPDDSLTLKALVSQQQSGVIIDSARDYQLELFERAKMQNTIACSGTGTGKTLIAVLLLRHILDQELELRAQNLPARVAFFLVDKVHLVFQQHGVLSANLDHKIAHFCGDMGAGDWDQAMWNDMTSGYMVMVCTARILAQALHRSFVTMSSINLLIFDEAHHAKKGHDYATIMNDFYLRERDTAKRPQVFAMTASPIDIQGGSIEAGVRQLEAQLDAQIETPSESAMLQDALSLPAEDVAMYMRSSINAVTDITLNLTGRFQNLPHFSKLVHNAKAMTTNLGEWCGNAYWSIAFAEKHADKQLLKVESNFQKQTKYLDVSVLDKEIETLRQAQAFVQSQKIGVPRLAAPSVSPKVIRLHQLLLQLFEQPSDTRCLVFVEQRSTAFALESLFNHLGIAYLSCGALVGVRTSLEELSSTSYLQHVRTLAKFKKGELNCLFATTVAEEGLDIPDCNVVVRFDPCKTMIQYIQSRGRARQKNSQFIHFVETDNWQQKERLFEVKREEQDMKAYFSNLSRHRRQETDDFGGNLLRETDHHRVYTEKATGATLTYAFCMELIALFVSRLPNSEGEDLQIQYSVSRRDGKFVSEITLPLNSPIQSAIGRPEVKKSIAKRSAAFEICIRLRRGQYLNENLMPVYQKQLPAMRNALLGIRERTSSMYEMQLKPSAWAEGRGRVPSSLFLTIVTLEGSWDQPVSPLGLLTRQRFGNFPSFPVFNQSSKVLQVSTVTFPTEIALEGRFLDLVTTFTLRIFKDLFNKTFQHDGPGMSYWLAPIIENDSRISSEMDDALAWIDQDLLRRVEANELLRWTPESSPESFCDKFVIDPWDGGRRFFTKSVRRDLEPIGKVPLGTAKGKYMESIIGYSVSLFGKARKARTWDLSQPVYEAERNSHRLNILASPTEVEKGLVTRCFICLEPLAVSLIPARVAAMGLLFPAIIHRLESFIIASEASRGIGLHLDPGLALEAITRDSDNTEQDDLALVGVQRGMGANYERLEFLGDCFLKMATSIALFAQNTTSDEFAFHVDRMIMICNKNLYNTAVEHKIYRYIRGVAFSRRTWYPQGLRLLEGRGAKKEAAEEAEQPLSKKAIADVCEALIGAALISKVKDLCCAPETWDDAVKAVSYFVQNPSHTMKRWADYGEAYKKPAYLDMKATAAHCELANQVQQEHNYRFRQPRLLRSAFNHPSLPTTFEGLPSYQRLEFLGDSLLDMTAVFHLYTKYPDKDPQWLTEHKMAMVSNRFLAALCVRLGFHRHLRHSTSGFLSQVNDFVGEITDAEKEAKGATDYWMGVKQPPKCLSDIVESFVGALFIDSNFNFAEVQRFFEEHVLWYFQDMKVYDTFANDHPTTKLCSLLSTVHGCHEYRLMSQELKVEDGSGSQVFAGLVIHGTVVGEGRADSSRAAKAQACRTALERIAGFTSQQYCIEFKCDCRKTATDDAPAAASLEKMGTAI